MSKVFNFNMGRYYAWENLFKYIKSSFRRHFVPKQYNFVNINPKISTDFQFVPFHQWKANKLRDQSEQKYTLLAIAFVSFLVAKFVYQVLEDDDKGYKHHVNNPIVSKSIQYIYADVCELTGPFFEIIPKDRYEVGQIYPRLYELIFKTEERKAAQDKKALELRKAVQEYDKEHQ